MKKHLSTQTRKRMLSSIGLILFSVSFVLAQVLVKGTVKDNLGEGVPGASVQVKGTSQGTITDLDGKFAFNVPNKNSILVISFIGYVTVEMKVDTQKPMVITLKEDTKTLDEVVVVGYQEIRKKDLTGSVAKASMAELLSTPTASFGETLGGRIAGVNVSSGEGMPGGQMNIVIRGNNSLTQDNSPLYVIDGFPVEDPSIAAAINQNDIESLDFLKDASATAIYGARGANGVVMITTKKGTIGQPKIKYDGSFGIQHITKTIPMMDAYEFVKLQAERSPKDMETTYFMNYDGKKWGLEDYRNIPQYNWQDEIFRSAWMQSHNVSLTGGSEGVRYNASLSYYDQDGILLESNYKRVQGRMGTTIQKKKLKIYLTTNYSSTTTTGGSPSQNSYSGMNNLFYSVWGYRPVTEPDRPLNSLMDNIMDDAINNTNDYRFNPIMSLKNEYRKTYANYIQFNGFAEYEFIKGLKLKVSGGYTFDTRKGETFNNSKTRYGNPKSSDKVNAEIYHSQRATWLNENILTYQTNIKRKHFFNSMVGVTLQNSDYEYYSYKTVQIPNEALGMAGMSEGTPSTTKSLKSSWSMLSFLGRLNYNYDEKYLLSVILRRDGSSRLNPKENWETFPSVSVGWRFDKEKFFPFNHNVVNMFKVRGSYGVLGNENIGEYVYQATMMRNNMTYSFGNVPVTGSAVSTYVNDNLRWEKKKTANVGIDVAMWNNRLEFTAEWYKNISEDLLYAVPVPTNAGVSNTSVTMNAATMENSGLEFSATYRNHDHPLKYDLSANLSTLNNKVTSLGFGNEKSINGTSITYVGKELGQFYGWVYQGIARTQEDLDNHVNDNGDVISQPGAQVGDCLYKDINNDGIINGEDQVVIGNAMPRMNFGISARLEYKGFDLTISTFGALNYHVTDDIYNSLNSCYGWANKSTEMLEANRWSEDGTTYLSSIPRTYVDRPAGASENWNDLFSSRKIQNAAYWKIANIELGYNFKDKWFKGAVSGARVYVSAQNLYTFTGYHGYNVDYAGGTFTPGYNFCSFPTPRTFMAGVRFSF